MLTTKRKVNVCLEDLHLTTEGVTVYLNEIVSRLMNYNDLELRGTIFRRSIFSASYEAPESYKHFEFPVTVSLLPKWVMFNQLHIKGLRDIARSVFRFITSHYSYNLWVRDKESEIFLFLRNFAPMFSIKGKVVTCLHDILPIRTPEAYPNDFVTYSEKAYPNAIKKSTRIITVSNFSKEDICRHFNITENQIDIVYNGVDADRFSRSQPEQKQLRKKLGLPNKYILHFGSCRFYKNVESLIRAYARLPEAVRHEYALVITNPNSTVMTCASENGVTPYYIENVSEDDKPAVYQMASLMVWPSLYEGFGIPVLEAMAAGTPVVCSNVTSLPEVAGDAAVLVNPTDIEAITAAMERCLYDTPFRQALIAKGHENVKRFTWDAAAKKLHDIIMSL